MKSGMLAAEAAYTALTSQPAGRPLDLSAYEKSVRSSWVSAGRLLCCLPLAAREGREAHGVRGARHSPRAGGAGAHARWHRMPPPAVSHPLPARLPRWPTPTLPHPNRCPGRPQIESELFRERNIRPAFSLGAGLWGGVAYSALDTYLLRGGAPWTLRHRWGGGRARVGQLVGRRARLGRGASAPVLFHYCMARAAHCTHESLPHRCPRPGPVGRRYADHERLRPAAECAPREYPKPDGTITFDLNTSLFRRAQPLL